MKTTLALPKNNDFYRNYYHYTIMLLMVLIVLLIAAIGLVMYQLFNRPLPAFTAIDPERKEMTLSPYTEPNLLPDTILRWASKAVITAYNFDWVNYEAQVGLSRPFFTDDGWDSFLNSINPVIANVRQGQLIVTGVVSGTPVISNHGALPGLGETWRVQIPFIVTYQAGSVLSPRNFMVTLNIVRIPTGRNPQAIGINEFYMVSA
jgi:intracellular multiplication protein IcmL